MKRNVLIFHLGALGDFVLTWPLVLALSRLHPQSRIICVTHAQKGKLAERMLGVESADIEAGWHHLFGDPAALPPAAGRMLAGAHSIYSFIAAPEDTWTRIARQLAGVEVCCLRPTPLPEFPRHATDYVLGQIDAYRVLAESMRQMIASLNHRGLSRLPGGDAAVIHPGSGSPAKCWPAENFLDLARRLTDAGRRVRFVLGETELERWPADRVRSFEHIAEVRRPATYLDLLDAFADADTFIGNDSGPGHLAGVLGLACTCLFGPTNPNLWRPLGPRVRIIHRNPIESISVDEVIQTIVSPR